MDWDGVIGNEGSLRSDESPSSVRPGGSTEIGWGDGMVGIASEVGNTAPVDKVTGGVRIPSAGGSISAAS